MSELLAEAIASRADMTKRLEQYRQRISAVVTSSEGEEVPEDANALIRDAMILAMDRAKLIARINQTNSQTYITLAGQTMSLTEALALRDQYAFQRKIISDAADGAAGTGRRGYALVGYRTRATELKTIIHIDVQARRAEADDLARQHRLLDMEIQKANFVTPVTPLTG